MAKGISIHVGLNSVDGAKYAGWTGPLAACEMDATDMHELATGLGYEARLLLTADATRAAVLGEFTRAAAALEPGDILFVSYSGHGGQLPDRNGDEDDGVDETWCLHDGQLVDDELAVAWSKFPKGVRVLLLSDSCHSGSVSRLAPGVAPAPVAAPAAEAVRVRAAPKDVVRETYKNQKAFYDELIASLPKPLPVPEASVRLISGCQDDQLSVDEAFNGRFTRVLKQVWDQGRFAGDYAMFHREIAGRMPPEQQPRHSVVGTPNAMFDAETPFRV